MCESVIGPLVALLNMLCQAAAFSLTQQSLTCCWCGCPGLAVLLITGRLTIRSIPNVAIQLSNTYGARL